MRALFALFALFALAGPAAAGFPVNAEKVSGPTLSEGDFVEITSTSESGASENCLVCSAEPMLWHITERSPAFDPCAPNISTTITVRGCGLPPASILEVIDVSANCYQFSPSCGEP